MTSDHEFLRQRLKLVLAELAQPDGEFVYTGQGRVRRRTQPAHRRDTRSNREARLLRKLLTKTREGQVSATMHGWRRHLGQFLIEHRRQFQEIAETYNDWWRLSPWQREKIPQPPKPPPPRFIDQDGAPWIIDDRFLILLDDLIERLQKWLAG